ncbi:MAG: FecR family protein [Mangrovibacterium sp.]
MLRSLQDKLEQLQSDVLTINERKKVLSLFHHPDQEYPLKDAIYRQLENFPDSRIISPEVNNEFEQLWTRIEAERTKQAAPLVKWNAVIYWSAAALVLGLVFGALIPGLFLHQHEEAFYTAIAPKGSVSETILPDSTRVFLNAGSSIRYRASEGIRTREVVLNGEAWFDVKHSLKIPFIVHTGFYDIRVTGTKFNVKAYKEDDEVITTLENGKIQAESANRFRMEKEIVLVPGEQLIYKKHDRSLKVNRVNPPIFSSWKDNKLIFINMSLRELIILLERKYGVDILVTDQDILNYHYDGTLKNETIIEVLNFLQETLPVYYEINDQTIKIKKK